MSTPTPPRPRPALVFHEAPTGVVSPPLEAGRGNRATHALGEIIRNLNQSLELERVTDLVVRHAAELLGARGARLWTLNDDDSCTLAATHGLASDPVGVRVPLQELFAGAAVQARRPVRTEDILESSTRGRDRRALFDGHRLNAVAAPLLVGGRPIGAVVVFSSDHDFDEDDEAVLLALAGHAAAAIENSRLYRAAARTARHASILSDAARTLATSVTPESVYAGLGRVVKRALHASGFAVFLADPDTREVTAVHADGTGSVGPAADVGRFWELDGGRVVSGGEPIFYTHRESDPAGAADAYGPTPRRGAFGQEVRGVALLPLVVERQPRGLLVLHFTHAKTFDEGERRLLTDFAAQVAVAMRNAALFADLELRAARLAAVVQRQHHISAAVSRDDVLAETYRTVAAVVDAPTFALLGPDDAGACRVPELVVVLGHALPAGAPPPGSIGGPTVDDSWRSGDARMASREHEGERFVELCVPVVYGERRFGVLQTQSPRLGAYDPQDVDMVTLVARQAAAAMENARLFAAQRAERERAEAAAAVAAAALAVGGLHEGAASILTVIGGLVPFDGGGLSVVIDGALENVAATGSLARLVGDRIPTHESAALRLLKLDASAPPSCHVGDIRAVARPTHSDLYPEAPARLVPLVARGRALGVFGATRALPFTGTEVEALERLAPTVALALDALLLGNQQRRQQERERVLAAALATMQQPVFILDAAGRIRYANAAAACEYGYAVDEFAGMDAHALVADGAPVAAGEQTHRRRDGGEFPASVVFGRIDAESDEAGHVLSVRNLTDERRVADTLRQTEKLAALGELVAGVAHELNNPLTGISAFAQLLMEEELSDDQMESVRLIKRESDRAGGVIRDLLVFSRKTGPRDVMVDVNALVLHTARLRGYGLRSAGIELETSLAPDLPPARGDDQKLQQVLLNLVVNAEYAMQRAPERRLKITTRQVDTSLELCVSDSGAGMSAETQQHIFEPFFTTKPAGVGTGLGLSVSYGIVQAHGGTITVDSAPGRGTAFRILLPVADAGDGRPAAPPAPSSAADA